MTTAIIPLKQLEEKADFFAGASLANATRRAYQSDWTSFQEFCESHDLTSLPASPETICLFLSDMADRGLSVSTITRRCTALTAVHEHFNHLSPVHDARVGRVLRGIKRTCGAPPARSRALSWKDIQHLVSHCDSMMIGLRDAAVLTLGWASAMRRSELVALNVGDIQTTEEGFIITIRRSKTDQEGQGYQIGIPRASDGLCPVERVTRWLNRMNEKNDFAPDTPLFPNIGRIGRGKWWWPPSGRLADRMVSIIVKQYCRYAGLPAEQYSAHSLRRGLATDAGAAGVPERIISRHTRHRSIAVLRSYIDEGTIWQENPLSAIYPSSSSFQDS